MLPDADSYQRQRSRGHPRRVSGDIAALSKCGSGRPLVLALAFSAFACGGNQPPSPTEPTPPPVVTPPQPSTFTVTGTVRETAPAPTPPLAGGRIEILGGPRAGETVLADSDGRYRLTDLAVQDLTVRASHEGYEPETKTITVGSNATLDFGLGHPWPSGLASMLERLPIVTGTKFKRAPGPGPSYYMSSVPAAVYVSPAPVGGEIGSVAHEICHGHQDRVQRDSGRGLLTESGYYATDEGKDFIQATGWRLENGQWIEKCEPPGWCGYRNPLEDSAQSCATYYNPGGFLAPLSIAAPIRYAWATRWLPR